MRRRQQEARILRETRILLNKNLRETGFSEKEFPSTLLTVPLEKINKTDIIKDKKFLKPKPIIKEKPSTSTYENVPNN